MRVRALRSTCHATYRSVVSKNLFALAIGISASLLLASDAMAQSTIGTAGASTTVQLPTFHVFGVSTSVLVPDRGSTYLGGVTRSASGRNEFGPSFGPRGVATGRSTTSASVGVTAWIHDLDAMDQAVLAEARRMRELGDQPTAGAIVSRGGALVRSRSAQPTLQSNQASLSETSEDGVVFEEPLPAPKNSLVDLLSRESPDRAAAEQEKAAILAKAEALVAEGKPSVAKIYFKKALRRSEGAARAEIAARLAEIEGSSREAPSLADQ